MQQLKDNPWHEDAGLDRGKSKIQNPKSKIEMTVTERLEQIEAELARLTAVPEPKFPEIYPEIKKVIEGKKILIYNANFDRGILNYCCRFHNLPGLNLGLKCEDVMGINSLFVAEYSNYYKDYKWQPLGSDHTAIGDCIAVVDLINLMAKAEIKHPSEDYFRENVYR